ncbi:MAG: bifunctional UDP-N-acetylglucosamine diphosphorylase/glucosamine-1-phosphate N-acetyltransferase GlmU [Magnetococcales bacterium]|nr:bifunctional UDP-N-acetylglucosamine diphosphorylase/glucosamine-1-phosphate N-acetyltransferase GlmU [Magnetococcales bacterium]
MSQCAVLILAAGLGTRMRSRLPKVLHTLAGRPLLAHVLATAKALNPSRIVVVVGYEADRVRAAFPDESVGWVVQEAQLGTGHAVRTALPALEGLNGQPLLILSGDVPLLEPRLLQQALEDHQQANRSLTVLTTTIEPPTGYGRLVRDGAGGVVAIIEERDADPTTRAITEINTGIYCVASDRLPDWLAAIRNDNAQQEYYLTDMVALAATEAARGGRPVGASHHLDRTAFMGINDRSQLAGMERIFRDRVVGDWMARGVTFVDPQSCWVAADAVIAQDTIIEPNVIIGPGVAIGADCHIGPFCEIRDSRLGPGVRIRAFCHLDGADLAGANDVGPYARLRPKAVLDQGAKVGNFCEVKKSRVGAGSKVNHLTYIGDAEIGSGVNVGAGTITCNYDGKHKHRTVLEDGVFIGSNTSLVAPVRVGAGAVVGAGSTVTKDVPPGALAVARGRQNTVENWAARKKK